MATPSRNVDSGWSWMILIAACIIMFIWLGIEKVLAVLLPTLKDQFDTHTWLIGIMITLMISVRDFSAPVIGALSTNENTRIIALISGSIVGFSTICASFVNNVLMLGFFISIINGISFSFLIVPTYTLLGQYFDKLYPLAAGIFYAGGNIGLMLLTPLTEHLLTTYGWRSALLIIGAITFHLVVSAALFRPAPLDTSTEQYVSLSPRDLELAYSISTKMSNYEENDTFGWMSEPTKHCRNKINEFVEQSGLSLFKNRSFLAVCVLAASINTTFTGWVVYFIPHCLVKGLTPFEASFLTTAAGFSMSIGYLIYIPFVSRNIISARGCVYISCTLAAITLFMDKLTVTVTTVGVANVLYTFALGVASPLCDVLLKSAVGPELLSKALGWRFAINGFVRLFPGFIVGWIYDQTGSYEAGFFIMGFVQAFGLITLAVDHIYDNHENRKY